MDLIKTLAPGFSVATITGLAALFLSEHYGAPAMLFALLLGIALSFLYEETQCKAGIDFTATHILRVGIALLGLRIVFSDLSALGWQTALMLIVAVSSTIGVGMLTAKYLKLRSSLGLLTGGAVGICGASAAMAISAILPPSHEKERDTLVTIVGVTAFSTLAMVLYPFIAGLLNLDEVTTGIFIGATIHDVAQVVGAGYSVSEQTGDVATLTKLIRVALLMPVIMCILVYIKIRLRSAKNPDTVSRTAPGIPGFLIAFTLLMIINSLVTLPPVINQSANELSRLALVLAITAIGMKSNLKQLLTVGLKPFCLLAIETSWVAGFILCSLWFLKS
ncbi:putative sulfate exporter family transporter [Paraglaciecola sp.]|uniref:YeiH family protein n=1 Tax=Paraglaciecola sp. TaxID=1920173 RepID=UPI0030F3DC95